MTLRVGSTCHDIASRSSSQIGIMTDLLGVINEFVRPLLVVAALTRWGALFRSYLHAEQTR